MKIKISRDMHGFLAEVEGYENIFAYGVTEIEAKKELLGVMEMIFDYHLEQVEEDRKIRNAILKVQELEYAVQL